MAAAPRLRIRPSELGWKGVLLFAALELAFLATSYSNLFFLMLVFCAALGLCGLWWTARNVRGTGPCALRIDPAHAGVPRPVVCTLAAGSRPRIDIAVELPLPGGPAEVAHFGWLEGEAEASGMLPPLPRSVLEVPYVTLVTRHPFGLFEARLEIPHAFELVTWPKPIEGANGGRAGAHAGDGGQHAPGRGSGLAGLRPFRLGDAASDVHWKATARRGSAVVKEREREAAHARTVVLDRRCDDASLEAALGAATNLVLEARHGTPLQLVSQDATLSVDGEHGGADEALRWLAATTTLPTDAAAPPHRPGARMLPDGARRVAP